MARTVEKLSPAAVRKANRPGLYGDGGGLWLHVGDATKRRGDKGKLINKSWVLRYMIGGKARSMGLGSVDLVPLAEARERARQMRHLLLDGVDPLEQRQAARRQRKVEAAKAISFKAAATRYIKAHEAGWRNAKHAAQWTTTLETYAYPVIGALPVSSIDTGHITRILEPIWVVKCDTAGRVRGRIETVLDYAKAHGWREGENPARWKRHLENVLPKPSKIAKPKHHAALAWKDVGDFMAELRKHAGIAARALEFTILAVARTGETIGAQWDEMDLKAKVWTIPGARMKGGEEHRIPLSDDAVAVLKQMAKLGDAGFVFKSGDGGLSNMAMLALLKDADRMNRPGVTVHGFRSTFADWCAETGKPEDIREAALAHRQGKVIAAYQRGDLLDRRRTLMNQWAAFCSAPFTPEGATVVALDSARAG